MSWNAVRVGCAHLSAEHVFSQALIVPRRPRERISPLTGRRRRLAIFLRCAPQSPIPRRLRPRWHIFPRRARAFAGGAGIEEDDWRWIGLQLAFGARGRRRLLGPGFSIALQCEAGLLYDGFGRLFCRWRANHGGWFR